MDSMEIKARAKSRPAEEDILYVTVIEILLSYIQGRKESMVTWGIYTENCIAY